MIGISGVFLFLAAIVIIVVIVLVVALFVRRYTKLK